METHTSYRRKLFNTTTEAGLVNLLTIVEGLLVAGLGLFAVSIVSLVTVLSASMSYLLFSPLANAGSIYIASCIGAGKISARRDEWETKARRYAWETIFLASLLGLLLGLLIWFMGQSILSVMGASDLIDQGLTYYLIVSVPCVINALYMALADILRGFGDTNTPKWAGWTCAVLQLVGTILSIHVFTWGLNGVAITQVTAMLICIIGLSWRARRFIAPFSTRRLSLSQGKQLGLHWKINWQCLLFILVHFELPVILRSLWQKTVWSERSRIRWELLLLAGPMMGGRFSWRMAHLIYQSSLLHAGTNYQALFRLSSYLTSTSESLVQVQEKLPRCR